MRARPRGGGRAGGAAERAAAAQARQPRMRDAHEARAPCTPAPTRPGCAPLHCRPRSSRRRPAHRSPHVARRRYTRSPCGRSRGFQRRHARPSSAESCPSMVHASGELQQFKAFVLRAKSSKTQLNTEAAAAAAAPGGWMKTRTVCGDGRSTFALGVLWPGRGSGGGRGGKPAHCWDLIAPRARRQRAALQWHGSAIPARAGPNHGLSPRRLACGWDAM